MTELHAGVPEQYRTFLLYPDVILRDAAIQQPNGPEDLHVQFRSGPHPLVPKTIEGRYQPVYSDKRDYIPASESANRGPWIISPRPPASPTGFTCHGFSRH